jgi:3D-(3,5/4)-trihydroxycyclohexane-1,2-dione acylhydrolase (decyclizing)
MSQEIATSIQEGYKLNIVVLDNHGFSSIGGLSRSCGSGGFGTEYRYRRNGGLEGNVIELDLTANAASLGAWAVRAKTRQDLLNALSEARGIDRTSVVVIETDINERVPGFESWWDVPIAETSKLKSVQAARAAYEEGKRKERYFFQQGNETQVPGTSVVNRAERKRP